MTRKLLLILPLLLPLAACEGLPRTGSGVGVSAGYNLPRTDACRDAAALPGKPIDPACLDAIGGP